MSKENLDQFMQKVTDSEQLQARIGDEIDAHLKGRRGQKTAPPARADKGWETQTTRNSTLVYLKTASGSTSPTGTDGCTGDLKDQSLAKEGYDVITFRS